MEFGFDNQGVFIRTHLLDSWLNSQVMLWMEGCSKKMFVGVEPRVLVGREHAENMQDPKLRLFETLERHENCWNLAVALQIRCCFI